MCDLFPNPPQGSLDARVRQQLDTDAQATDGDAVVNRAFARLDEDARRPLPISRSGRRWRPVLAASLVAAGLMVCFLILTQPTAQAEPATLVAAALQASAPEVDRCYLLQVERLGDDDQPSGSPLRESHLWTRGDRYRIDLLDSAGSLGQDEKHRIWIAPSRREGAYFDPDETPEKLALASDLRTLRLDLLLRELTRGFELRWDDPDEGDSTRPRRILATPRKPRRGAGIQRVLLEIEPDSNNVRRLVVDRLRPTLGLVRITLTWLRSDTQPDGFYHLKSALNPDAPQYDRRRNLLRGKVILEAIRRFGAPLGA